MDEAEASAMAQAEAYEYRKRCEVRVQEAEIYLNEVDAALKRAESAQETCKVEFNSANEHSAELITQVEEWTKRVAKCKAKHAKTSNLCTMWDNILEYTRFFVDSHPQKYVDVQTIKKMHTKQHANLNHKQDYLDIASGELAEACEKKDATQKRVANAFTSLKHADAQLKVAYQRVCQANHQLAEARSQLKYALPHLKFHPEDGPVPMPAKRRKFEHDQESYAAACSRLGRVLLSRELAGTKDDNRDPQELFNIDLVAFMCQRHYKLSRIQVDKRFHIFMIVLKNGGIANVIKKRKLGVVAIETANKTGGKPIKTTTIRKVCTHDLYVYEQKLVHDRTVPHDEWETVKMLNTYRI